MLHAPLESAHIPARNTQEKYVATQEHVISGSTREMGKSIAKRVG